MTDHRSCVSVADTVICGPKSQQPSFYLTQWSHSEDVRAELSPPLSPPTNFYVEVLTPSTLEEDHLEIGLLQN